MGVWNDAGNGFPATMGDGALARLLQSLLEARAAQAGQSMMPGYIEPPGPNTVPPRNAPGLPFMGADGVMAATGGDRIIPRPAPGDNLMDVIRRYGLMGLVAPGALAPYTIK